jgi:hypothetical protein
VAELHRARRTFAWNPYHRVSVETRRERDDYLLESWERMTFGGINGLDAVSYQLKWRGTVGKDIRFNDGYVRYANGDVWFAPSR